jgi:CDP-4-dehydro-6-deoxyglucose reductase, E1
MIKLIKSTFYKEAIIKNKLVNYILKEKKFSMGTECKNFEINFARKQQRKYAVFVSSGSMANLILVQALLNLNKLKKGDKVALSSLTWSTNVMPFIQLGLKPILLDCELSNLNVSGKILKKNFLKNKFKMLFLTNVLGFAADLDKIKSFCQKNKILLCEDNCESLGSKISGKLLGNFGLASTFSTFVGHHFSTIEGGIICTDDETLYKMLIIVRAHGWDRNLPSEEQVKLQRKYKVDDFFSKYTFYDLAFNGRPTEIQGFIANLQLEYLTEIFNKRQKNFSKFLQAARKNKNIFPLELEHMDFISNFAMPLIFKTNAMFKKYKDLFVKNNVEIRPIIAGNIANQPFYKKYIKTKVTLKNASLIHQNGFYFGNNPEMTDKELNLLCQLLKSN